MGQRNLSRVRESESIMDFSDVPGNEVCLENEMTMFS